MMFQTGKYKWTNWAANHSCEASNYYEPETEEDICTIVSNAGSKGQRIRVVGSGHSFSPIALCEDVLISLKQFRKIISIEGNLVTCQAGIFLHELYAALQAAGLSLPNFGVINKQTLAGAIATGTHGSGLKHKSLSGEIEKLTLILADGTILEIDRNTSRQIDGVSYNLWDAASISLGLLGIVSSVTLRCEPLFYLRSQELTIDFDDYIQTMDDLAAGYEYFKAWWFPHTGKVYVFKAERIGADVYLNRSAGEDHADWQKQRDRLIDPATSPMFIRSNKEPDLIPEINQYCLDYFFTPRTRIGTSFEILVHDETVPMVVSEYALPFQNQMHKKALLEFRAALESSALKLHFPVDLRYGAAETSWLSPACNRPSFYIGVCVREYKKKEMPASMNLFFGVMKHYEGRPNWGKLFELSPSELQHLYPALSDFKKLKKNLDPGTMFSNKYLDNWFGNQIS